MRKIAHHARIMLLTVGVVALVSLLACDSEPTPPAGTIEIDREFPDLSFQEMTNLVQPDDTSGLIFITEQKGAINAFAASQLQQGSYVFLDITDRVNRGGNEEGLLGLAFDPNYLHLLIMILLTVQELYYPQFHPKLQRLFPEPYSLPLYELKSLHRNSLFPEELV